MSHDNTSRLMDQRIFQLGLPVESVSLYLLCCGMADSGGPITRQALAQVWNSTPQALDSALADLVRRGILQSLGAEANDSTEYVVTPATQWA